MKKMNKIFIIIIIFILIFFISIFIKIGYQTISIDIFSGRVKSELFIFNNSISTEVKLTYFAQKLTEFQLRKDIEQWESVTRYDYPLNILFSSHSHNKNAKLIILCENFKTAINFNLLSKKDQKRIIISFADNLKDMNIDNIKAIINKYQ